MGKKAILPAILTLAACLGLSSAASAESVYGQGVTRADAVSVDDVVGSPARFDGKEAAVSGLVVDVCSVRGCWLELAGSDPDQTIRVQVQEGEVAIPMEVRGRSATVQGRVEVVASSQLLSEACSGCPSARGLIERQAPTAFSVRIIASGVVVR